MEYRRLGRSGLWVLACDGVEDCDYTTSTPSETHRRHF
jgi:ssDNA-binding Zn-finger/Zn-ribbon topoisomerase 1